MSVGFDVRDVAQIFNHCFEQSTRTRLQPGAAEPLYQPSDAPCGVHVIYSTRDYFASALHEISHWCLAGQQRRQLIDYGYWYEPDGRTPEQQAEFERVEVKPQALEWVFAEACGYPFRLSVDNLNAPGHGPSEQFKSAVCAQARHFLQSGLPNRAHCFASELGRFFKHSAWQVSELQQNKFKRSRL